MMIADYPLSSYLDRHHLRSTTTITMLELLVAKFDAQAESGALRQLLAEAFEDHEVVGALITRLKPEQTPAEPVQAAAVAVRQSRGRPVDEPALETIETLMLLIEAKRLLWTAMAACVAYDVRLRSFDYDQLTKRAERQSASLETLRLVVLTGVFPV